MKLNELRPARGAVKKRKRVGRGPGSGQGKTAGHGHKGEQARAGRSKGKSFEGGQMPLTRRLPKFGFKNPFRVEYQVVNVGLLEERFDDGQSVDTDALHAHGLLHKKGKPVKVLGGGNITKKLTVKVDAASDSARKKIEGAGGTVAIQTVSAQRQQKNTRAAAAS